VWGREKSCPTTFSACALESAKRWGQKKKRWLKGGGRAQKLVKKGVICGGKWNYNAV